ncbi:MAG: hypothetical protein V4494_00145 [Chlamydiota bacterium]
MFSKITWRFSLVFTLIALLWISQVCFLRSGDLEIIKTLKKEKELATSQGAFSTTTQKREGVRKEIWFSQEDNVRLHYRIESQGSLLTFIPKENKVDIVENLDKLKFWMQDKLYTSPVMQEMRFLEADHGTYRMTAQEFFADTVSVSLFRIPGSDLPEKIDPRAAFLRGVSQNIFFSISGNSPQFEAENFKAHLN